MWPFVQKPFFGAMAGLESCGLCLVARSRGTGREPASARERHGHAVIQRHVVDVTVAGLLFAPARSCPCGRGDRRSVGQSGGALRLCVCAWVIPGVGGAHTDFMGRVYRAGHISSLRCCERETRATN